MSTAIKEYMSTVHKVRAAREKNPNIQAAEIAKNLGVSRERIRQALVELGLPTRVRKTPELPPGNRGKLIAFRDTYHLTQTRVAEILATTTKRPCSVRIVQAWEASADKKSARPCPDWAITVLDEADAAIRHQIKAGALTSAIMKYRELAGASLDAAENAVDLLRDSMANEAQKLKPAKKLKAPSLD